MRILFALPVLIVGVLAFIEWQGHNNELAFIVMNINFAALCTMMFLDLRKQPVHVCNKKKPKIEVTK